MKTLNSSSTLSCIIKCIRIIVIMINKKIIFGLFILSFLGACAGPTAMLGPAYTFGSSGSVLQTGLSYGSNKVYTKYKEEKNDKELQETMKSEKRNHELKNLLKAQITKTRKKLKIIN